jgi:hypothetical protein
LEATQNDLDDNQARELRKENGKTNHKQNNTNDMTICLPEFGFQMKPTSPLRCPKGLGLFQSSQAIPEVELEFSLFSQSRDLSLCGALHTLKSHASLDNG